LTTFKVKGIRMKGLIFLAILLASTGVMGGYAAFQSEIVPLDVKEPLEILAYDSNPSLYPGETLQFNVSVENHASVNYNVSLTFSLNDSRYQEKYTTFSNNIYTIEPSKNILDAWIFVLNTAPAAKLELTIGITRDSDSSPTSLPAPKATPFPPDSPTSDLTPSATLLGAGARWAARNGTSALYINWLDNYYEHHFSDGANWGPYWGENYLAAIKNTTAKALEQQGFKVTCVADVPNNISSYDLVVFEAWFAVEPKDTPIVRDYLASGGNVVIIGGVPCFFSTYCKDLWPYVTNGQNLASLQDWFGSSLFVNSGGTANLVVDNPFGTSLLTQNKFYFIDAYGCYALTSMSNDSTVLAKWSDGSVFAFTHEYNKERVYYQAAIDWY
jgi:hypothetical protein